MKNMNYKQRKILRNLVKKNGQKYSELYSDFNEEDRFPYHIKYLQKKGYVNKRENLYYVTKIGMIETSNFDSRTLVEHDMPIPLILFVCKYKDKYLISVHFKDDESRRIYTLPFCNLIKGETLEKTSQIEFKRRYRVKQDFKYRNTFHIIHKSTDGDIIFDNIVLVFDAKFSDEKYKETANKQSKDGQLWLSKEEIQSLKNRHLILDKLIIENRKDPYLQDEFIQNYGIYDEDL